MFDIIQPVTPGSLNPKSKRDREALKRSSDLMTKYHPNRNPCSKFKELLEEQIEKDKDNNGKRT